MIVLILLHSLPGHFLIEYHMTLLRQLKRPHHNYISRTLSPIFSIYCLDYYLRTTSLTFITSSWLVILCSNSFQISYHKPVVCVFSAWFSQSLSGFLFIGQQTHVVAPQRHWNPLRINQCQDGAFLINSVWSCRCIQPHWHTETWDMKCEK